MRPTLSKYRRGKYDYASHQRRRIRKIPWQVQCGICRTIFPAVGRISSPVRCGVGCDAHVEQSSDGSYVLSCGYGSDWDGDEFELNARPAELYDTICNSCVRGWLSIGFAVFKRNYFDEDLS